MVNGKVASLEEISCTHGQFQKLKAQLESRKNNASPDGLARWNLLRSFRDQMESRPVGVRESSRQRGLSMKPEHGPEDNTSCRYH